MQVLTDAQWAKFEAAIAAVKLRRTRPRKEDRRTIEAIIWRHTNGAKWNPTLLRPLPSRVGQMSDSPPLRRLGPRTYMPGRLHWG